MGGSIPKQMSLGYIYIKWPEIHILPCFLLQFVSESWPLPVSVPRDGSSAISPFRHVPRCLGPTVAESETTE